MPPDPTFAIPGLMDLQSPVSDALPPYIDLPPHSFSNTLWIGIESIGPVTDDGSQMPMAAAKVIMEFSRKRLTPDVIPFYVISSDDDQITITHPADWLFSVPAQELPLDYGHWEWSLKITDTAGNILRLYDGGIYIKS